jgi:hypothetical protein
MVIYWRWFVDYLSREGKVIREAKATFGAAALVIAAAAIWTSWKVSSSFFDRN